MSTIPIGPPAVPPISPQRSLLVDQARQSWIRKLIDLSRRNNLLYFRSLKTGTLDLVNADQENMAAFLRGEDVSVKKLLPTAIGEATTNTVREIARRAMANLEEKGLQTLFVTMGQATWPATDGGRPAEAPILLIPALFETRGSNNFYLKRNGTVQANFVLLHVFETQFGVKLNPDDLLAKLSGDEEGEPFDVSSVYTVIRDKCSAVPGLDIKDFTVLGNFAFQKMAMVKDLQERSQELSAHDIISAIAGDSDARSAVSSAQHELEPRQLDQVSPDNEFNVLDADSSQQCAIADILAGQSAVIHGPPGTGKSQTIANLVASLAAAGKRVLFVAEKRAALQVVLKRLQQVGLDKIAIDLHGADVSPRRVMEQVAAALNTVRQAVPVDCDRMHQQYVERRDRLNRHVESLHRRRKPSGMSVYELQGTLLHLQSEVQSDIRWRGPELTKIEKADPARIRDLLREAGGLALLFLRSDPSPWNGVRLADGAAAQQAIDLVARLSSQTWPELMLSLAELPKVVGFRTPKTLKDAQQMYSLLTTVRKTLDLYSTEVFTQNIQGMIRALAPGKAGGLRGIWTWCASGEYRRARNQALSCRIAGKTRGPELFAELSAAEDQRMKWAELSSRSSLPQTIPSYADSHRKLDLVVADLAALTSIVPRKQLDSLSLDEVAAYIDALAKDRLTPMKLPKLCEVEQGLDRCGAGKLVEELRKKKMVPEKWVSAFDQSWYSSSLEAAQAEDPEIAGFNGRTHDAFVGEFK